MASFSASGNGPFSDEDDDDDDDEPAVPVLLPLASASWPLSPPLYPLAWRFCNENARTNQSGSCGQLRSTRYSACRRKWGVSVVLQ